MTKFFRNDVGSLVVDRVPSSDGHFRLWTAFSGAAFRRKIFYVVSCGGTNCHRHHLCEESNDGIDCSVNDLKENQPVKMKRQSSQSERHLDLLRLSETVESGVDIEKRKKEEVFEELKCAVKDLIGEDSAQRKMAASKVRLLTKEDSEARKTIAMLGAIPPLIGMLDLEDNECRVASLYALLNLGIGNDENKAAIVKAGAIHEMLNLIGSENALEPSISEAIVVNFLALSALDSNKPVIGSSGAIQFLVKNLQSFQRSKSQAKQDALRALYNLSIFPPNISVILNTNLIPFLLNALGDMEVTGRSLLILGNMVAIPEGGKAINEAPDAFPILVDVLNWTDSPGCQEKAAYILMVMSHKAYGDRHAMIEAGIMTASLELTLLGSPLAQKRASRILECMRMDKGKQVSTKFGGNMRAAVSAPIYGSSSSSNQNMGSHECLEDVEDTMSEEKKAVKQLVQQSLQTNMRRIVKRANLPQDFVPSYHFKTLTSSSTSKSLPF